MGTGHRSVREGQGSAAAGVAAALFWFAAGTAFAQESTAFVDQIEGASLPAASGERPSPIARAGRSGLASADLPPDPIRNVAIIRQEGRANASRVEQTGRGNFAAVEILRSDGNTTSQTQRGARNVSRIAIVSGGGNSVSTEQTGNDNRGELTLENSNGIDIRLRQDGNGLNYRAGGIALSTSGTDGRPILIEQTGR